MITKEQATEALNKTRNPTLPVAYGTLRQYIEETADLHRQLAEAQAAHEETKARLHETAEQFVGFMHGEHSEVATKLAEAQKTIRNLEARDIHSCGPDCQRSGCVNRGLREQLVAAQAVTATVREDMERELRFECDSANIAGNVMLRLVQRLYRTPSDDTALREMLAEQWDKAAAEQREAAAKVVDRFISGDGELNEVWIHDITEAIRAMPLVIDK